jgi:tetratricopeptide (TPR) repeat protein
LADKGDTDAARMAAKSLTEMGDCLLTLGRLDEAAEAYEEGIRRSESLKDERTVAVGKGQLGTVRLYQKLYADALEAYEESRGIFEDLGEPSSVATLWHQTAMVHEDAGQYDAAEQAYRKSLAIEVRMHNPAGEASTLLQLGNLFDKMGRLEESVVLYRQAADKYVEIKSPADEGLARNNVAHTLIKLHRYAEAREEILRAIECDKPYGHASEPWKTWNILHDLETAEGNPDAAREARQKAFDLFLAYRNDGGENHEMGGRLCLHFRQAMEQGNTGELTKELAELANDPQQHPLFKLLITKLQCILGGERGAEMWEDEGLWYKDAVEIYLLLNPKAQ